LQRKRGRGEKQREYEPKKRIFGVPDRGLPDALPEKGEGKLSEGSERENRGRSIKNGLKKKIRDGITARKEGSVPQKRKKKLRMVNEKRGNLTP